MTDEPFVKLRYYSWLDHGAEAVARQERFEGWRGYRPEVFRLWTECQSIKEPNSPMFSIYRNKYFEVSACLQIIDERPVLMRVLGYLENGGTEYNLELSQLEATARRFVKEMGLPDAVSGNFGILEHVLRPYGKAAVEHQNWYGGWVNRWVADIPNNG